MVDVHCSESDVYWKCPKSNVYEHMHFKAGK